MASEKGRAMKRRWVRGGRRWRLRAEVVVDGPRTTWNFAWACPPLTPLWVVDAVHDKTLRFAPPPSEEPDRG